MQAKTNILTKIKSQLLFLITLVFFTQNSNAITLNNISTLNGGSINSDQTICPGTQPANLVLVGYSGNIIRWEISKTADFSDPEDIEITSSTLSGNLIGNLSNTVYIRAVVEIENDDDYDDSSCDSNIIVASSDDDDEESIAYSNYVTITVTSPNIGGTLSSNQTICYNAQPASLNLTGNTGNVIKWQKSTSSIFTVATDINSTASSLTGTSIGSLTATTYFRAVVQNGTCSDVYSNRVTITVNSINNGGTIAGNNSVCINTQPSNLTLSGQTGTVVRWQKSTSSTFTSSTNIAITSTTLTGAVIGNVSATTYFRAIVRNGSCGNANSATFTISVNTPSIGGTVSGTSTICSGTEATDLSLSGQTGAVLKWQQANDAAFTTPTDINSTATTLTGTTIGNINETTYFRAVIQNGACGVVNSAAGSIKINTTTWNGTSWNNGIPTPLTTAIMTGNYNSTVNLYACSLIVKNNALVVVNPTNNFIITRSVTVEAGASLTFESNANLVQIDNVSNYGNIIVKRNTNAQKRMDYVLWSSPVAGQNLRAFSPLTLVSSSISRFYTYNTLTDQFKYIFTPENYTFTAAKGYLIRMPNTYSDTTPAVFNGKFEGVPNNGNITIETTLSGATDGGTHIEYNSSGVATVLPNISRGYNAIGNPYPSPINADAFMSANNISEALYFWRKTNNTTTSSYATYSYLGSTANIGGLSTIAPNGTIQVGQGFFIKATSNSVTFTNAMRKVDNNNQFLRPIIHADKSRIWLNLASETAPANQMLIGYMDGATQDIDAAIDGKYINDSPIALNSLINNQEYIIQGRGLPFLDTDVVPLTFKTNIAGRYSISIDHVDGLFQGNQNIFLKDKLTNVVHNLKQGTYTFATVTGTFNNRFELNYNNMNTSAKEHQITAENMVVYNENGVIKIDGGAVAINNVAVFDIQGRLISEQNGINATSVAISNLKATQQVLIVQITTNDNTTIAKKIIY